MELQEGWVWPLTSECLTFETENRKLKTENPPAEPAMSTKNRHRIHYRLAADAKRAGMTLVEIVVVVAILLVLTSVLSYGVMSVFKMSKRQVATLDIQRMGTRVTMYEANHGAPPTTAEGLEAVVRPDEVRNDPWNSQYEYRNPGPGSADFDIVSYAEDGAAGGDGWDEDIRHSDL